jgi:glycosyltransferase involved in cell wall biosynthesis
MQKTNFVISAVNIFEGGPLTLLKSCLIFLNSSNFIKKYNFIVLVHRKELFKDIDTESLTLIEFPNSRKSYLIRIKLEYFTFFKFAISNNVKYWLSLHDISPILPKTTKQFVYCHNPSPFSKISVRDFFVQPKFLMFCIFYIYIYKINIKSNAFVIVQQNWIKYQFHKKFYFPTDKIVVAPPEISFSRKENIKLEYQSNLFFYPTLSRRFKNIEVICKAAELLNKNSINDFIIMITIDGSENKYAKSIVNRYKRIKQLKFIGLIPKSEVFKYYEKAKCLLFPSKLETWGLPITEFKTYNKPIILSNLPYAKETVGNYDKVLFFNPDNFNELFNLMKMIILDYKINYDLTTDVSYEKPYAKTWNDLFDLFEN